VVCFSGSVQVQERERERDDGDEGSRSCFRVSD
jgi:hypothetical protein